MKWDELNMAQKNELMKIYIKNGVTSLDDMRSHFNSFALGGNKDNPDNPPKGVVTRLKEKIIENKITNAINDLGIEELRRRLYENIDPYDYYGNALRDFNKAVKNEKASELIRENSSLANEYQLTPHQINVTDEIFAKYLQIPENNRHTTLRLQESNYKPTKSNNNATYYRLPLEDKDIQNLIAERFSSDYELPFFGREAREIPHPIKVGENKLSYVLGAYNLGTHTVGRGYDKDRGEYVSYYDLWDLNPVDYEGGEDLSHGVGKPFELYDRIYLDDYYGLNTKGIYLPEVIIKP